VRYLERMEMTSEEICLNYLETIVYLRTAALATYILETGWYEFMSPEAADILLEYVGEVEHGGEIENAAFIVKGSWKCLIHTAVIRSGHEVGCLPCLIGNSSEAAEDLKLYWDNK